jgi:hypothetical protein
VWSPPLMANSKSAAATVGEANISSPFSMGNPQGWPTAAGWMENPQGMAGAAPHAARAGRTKDAGRRWGLGAARGRRGRGQGGDWGSVVGVLEFEVEFVCWAFSTPYGGPYDIGLWDVSLG